MGHNLEKLHNRFVASAEKKQYLCYKIVCNKKDREILKDLKKLDISSRYALTISLMRLSAVKNNYLLNNTINDSTWRKNIEELTLKYGILAEQAREQYCEIEHGFMTETEKSQYDQILGKIIKSLGL